MRADRRDPGSSAGRSSQTSAVIGYGVILKPELMSIPTHGMINAHASLLPLYRGALDPALPARRHQGRASPS